MANYFDINVKMGCRGASFSVPVKIEDNSITSGDDVVEFALKNNILTEEYSENVNYVEDITEEEYNDMKGI